MTISECTECHGAVSTDAAACPHCGKRSPGGAKVGVWANIPAVLQVLLIVGVFGALALLAVTVLANISAG